VEDRIFKVADREKFRAIYAKVGQALPWPHDCLGAALDVEEAARLARERLEQAARDRLAAEAAKTFAVIPARTGLVAIRISNDVNPQDLPPWLASVRPGLLLLEYPFRLPACDLAMGVRLLDGTIPIEITRGERAQATRPPAEFVERFTRLRRGTFSSDPIPEENLSDLSTFKGRAAADQARALIAKHSAALGPDENLQSEIASIVCRSLETCPIVFSQLVDEDQRSRHAAEMSRYVPSSAGQAFVKDDEGKTHYFSHDECRALYGDPNAPPDLGWSEAGALAKGLAAVAGSLALCGPGEECFVCEPSGIVAVVSEAATDLFSSAMAAARRLLPAPAQPPQDDPFYAVCLNAADPDRGYVTSAELETALQAAGLLEGPAGSREHSRIKRIMGVSGWAKRTITGPDGERFPAFAPTE
jgi:hypothetical protein